MGFQLTKGLPMIGDTIEKIEIGIFDYHMTFTNGKKIFLPLHNTDEHPHNFIQCMKDLGYKPFDENITWEQYDEICEKCKERSDYETTGDWKKRIELEGTGECFAGGVEQIVLDKCDESDEESEGQLKAEL